MNRLSYNSASKYLLVILALLLLPLASFAASPVCNQPATVSTEEAGCGCTNPLGSAYKYNGDGTRDVVYWKRSDLHADATIYHAEDLIGSQIIQTSNTYTCGYPGYWLGYNPNATAYGLSGSILGAYVYTKDGSSACSVTFETGGHLTCAGIKDPENVQPLVWIDNTSFEIRTQPYLELGDFGPCAFRCDGSYGYHTYGWKKIYNNGNCVCVKYLPDSYKTGLVDAASNPVTVPDSVNGYQVKICKVEHQKCASCALTITSLNGTGGDLNPTAGGTYPIKGTLSDSSGQDITWTLTTPDGKEQAGHGLEVGGSWNGRLANGTVATEDQTYTATLSAKTADGNCTATKELKIRVVRKPDSCGLYVDFGSSAHLASGNLSHSQNLFSSRGNSLPLGLTLYYNSLDPANNVLGRGWSHSYSHNLKENSDGSVLISEPNWRYKYYTASGSGYSSSAGNYAVLAKDANGFSLTERDGTLYHYTVGGQLISITDRNGNSQTFSYTANNLTSVIDPAGRTVSFNYDGANHLTSISDPLGNSYTLGVGTTLNVVTQPDSGSWQYSYDANGFMLGKVDPLGNSFSYSYDDQHRVTGSIDPEGKTRSISYPQGTETIKNTTFTEKDGSSWSYSYDTPKGYLLSKTDPQSGTTSYQYDANGNRSATTNPDGTGTSALYDNLGNMLSSTDAAGAVTSYSYNSFGQATSITDPQGGITRYSYDAKGNLTSLTDAAGAVTSYEYDSKGNMSRVTDAAGQSSSFSYDAAGNMTSVTDASGATTRYSYDASGNVTTITDAKGGVTSFSYDSRGRLIKTVNPQGNATSYSYDKNGNKLSATDANNNTTRYEYNSRNQLLKTIDALGNSTVYSYGASSCPSCNGGVDKLTTLSDANNNVTRYDYDSLGRLTKETDPLGKITSYSYDAKGNLIARTDAKGQTISYSYDANGRLLKKSYPDNTEESFSYDAKGNILTAANKNIAYSFSYDAAGRMLSSSDSNGNTISYSYDAAGRKTRTVYPDGSKISYGYDTAGRLASISDQHNNRFSLTYSSLGQRTQLGYPNGVVTGYAYDASGNLTRLNHQSHGRPVSTFSYTHDKVGNRLTRTELFRTTNYTYDSIYRLLTARINRRAAEQYSYDPVGNRLTGPEQGTDYRYGIGNQLLQQEQTGYSYDDNGNLAQRSISRSRHSRHCDHHNQPWNYRFDYENRLIEADNGDITVSFSYDPFGRRIEKKVEQSNHHGRHEYHGNSNEQTTRYLYDGQALIQESTTQGNHRAARPETVSYIHGPNIDEPLQGVSHNKTWYYHADGLGSVVALTDKHGNVVQRYDYDSFGNLEQQGESIDQPFTYTAREFDEETGLYYYRARYYDPQVGRFVSRDPLSFGGGDINLYGYVQNNPVNTKDPDGLYSSSDILSAWNHYCDGSGTSWSTSFSSINWGGLKSKIYNKIASMVKCCENPDRPQAVDFTINAQTEGADKYIVGRHIVKVKGVLNINKDKKTCSWSFNGDMSSALGYDPYDFDPSNRGLLGETLTWIGRNRCPDGAALYEAGKSFNIYISGYEPLSFKGSLK